MCIRDAIGKLPFGESQTGTRRRPIPLVEFDAFAVEWARKWCVTPEGRSKWRFAAWEAMLLAFDEVMRNKLLKESPDVGLHILLSDYVEAHGVRPDIKDFVAEHSSGAIMLIKKVSVVLPFASNDRVRSLQKMLEANGILSGTKQREPKSKGKAAGWVSILTMYTNQTARTGTLYEYPCEIAEDKLLDWQRKKLSQVAPCDARGVVPVADDAAFLTALRNSADVVTLDVGSDDSKITSAEQQLRDVSNASAKKLFSKLRGRPSHAPPVVVVLVGPMAVGKSRIGDALMSKGFFVCSADIHMNAGGRGFDPTRLEKCHMACQRDVADALLSGSSAVVDNTSMIAMHRTVYAKIAYLLNVELIVCAVAPELWLESPEFSAVVDTLASRDKRRALKLGTAEIGRSKIERVIKLARADCAGDSTGAWLDRFPPADYSFGVLDLRNALVYRSAALIAAAEEALTSPRVAAHPRIAEAHVTKGISRGFGEFHVSLLTPKEHRSQKDLDIAALSAAATAAEPELEIGDVGRVEAIDGSWALFLVVSWEWAAQFRASLGLPPKDLHITLAFSVEDIHNVPKGAESCAW